MIEAAPPLLTAAFAGLGLLVGSFVGLASLRLPAGTGIVRGRSRCGGCDRPLPAWRLIPLVSYVWSRARCVDCGARIPVRYPLLEGACALIGAAAGVTQPDLPPILLTALLGWQLLLIAVVDGEHFWLPDRLTLPLLATGLIAAAILDRQTLIDAGVGTVVGFASLWLLARAYRRLRGREGLGGGDPILLAAGGAWVGWTGLPSVLLWAATAGLSLVAARRLTGNRVAADDRLPFGVFLAAGIWLTWVFGPLGLPG